MCRSVPQIAVFSRRMRTSFGPGTGTGTCSIQIPLPASRFTSAFIIVMSSKPGMVRKRAAIILAGPVPTGHPPRMRRSPTRRRPTRKTLFATVLLLAATARADEGMWMPSQLPDLATQLRAAGFQGNPADLADLTRAPMNAVVKVGGATGAFVSKDGLVLTNHHVAFGVIQYNAGRSSDGSERDLIKDGFVAADRAGELPANPDYRVLVTTGFDRITDRILGGARGKQGRAYYDAVD